VTTFWTDRRVLVTGATGLVGSWLVDALLEARADVVCLVRDWVPQARLVQISTVERCMVVRGDVRDQPLLERTLGEYEVEVVIHLAAQTIVGIANRNPISTFESNIQGTWTLLEACRHSPKVGSIVVASSDKAYGEHDTLPYDETMPLRGVYPYDVSKSCADLIATSYAKTFGLPVVVTRCANFFGGGDLNWNRLVPGTIRSAVRGERPVIRSDGNYVRDWLYVEDGALAYMLVAERLAADRKLAGEAFNFSNEVRIPVKELTARLLGLMGSDLVPDILDVARGEIPKQYLSSERARHELAWKPRYDLDEGLRRTIAWYRAFLARRDHG